MDRREYHKASIMLNMTDGDDNQLGAMFNIHRIK
jgi:hypothetical protein